MSSHPLSNRGARVSLAVLLALTVLVTMAALTAADHPEDEDANQGGSGLTEWTGDWSVGAGDDLEYANQTISLDGNLQISDGGRLVLRNVTLTLHGEPLANQEIGVYDGTLVITDLDGDAATEADRSVVEADDPAVPYYFAAFEGAALTVTNSLIQNCGESFNLMGFEAGLYIGAADAVVEGTEFAYGYGGLFIDGEDITVRDCHIHDNDWIGIYVDNMAAATIVDCTIEDNLREGMMVRSQSDVVVQGSWVRGNLRGIVVLEAYLHAYNTTISNNEQVDMDLPSFSQVQLVNCTLSTTPSFKAVTMENSTLISTHGNFDIGKVNMVASKFYYQQFLTVTVTWTDSANTPIPDVAVTVEDAEGRITHYTTDEQGRAADLPMQVVFYEMTPLGLETTSYNPFFVTVTFNAVDKEDTVDLRYGNGQRTFRYTDTVDPTAVAPSIAEADVGTATILDGSRCNDNVAIESWNWSFEELGEQVFLDGEQVTYHFRQAKEYSITLKVTDTSGNTGTSSMTTFKVSVNDRSPPVVDPGPDQEVDQGAVVTFDGSNSTDNVGVVSYTWSFRYEDVTRSLTGMLASWKFDVPGEYPVVLTVEDGAGLTDTGSMTVKVLDKIAPVTKVTFEPEMPVGREYGEVVQVLFNVEDGGGGQVELNYRINGAIWEKVVGGLALSFGDGLQYGDGTYVIEYFAVDAAGNREETQTEPAFLVDATAPTFTDVQPPLSPYTTSEETYTISGRTEEGSTLTINDQVVTVGAEGYFSFEATLQVGDNAYYLHAVDEVGHTADQTIVIVREEYGNGTDGDDGGGNLWYFVGGAVVAIVLVLLLLYFFVLRDRTEEPPPM